MLDAALGLAYLHAKGVLHRDIKPDNVLVFALDEVLAVNEKLTDFGSSQNVNTLMTDMTFTLRVGSPVDGERRPEEMDDSPVGRWGVQNNLDIRQQLSRDPVREGVVCSLVERHPRAVLG